MNPVDLVIPVYDGFSETVACLESVVATVDLSWCRIVIVNDCSPNSEIREYLQAFQMRVPTAVMLENAENLGFVASVNRGMRMSADRDVLLLNSDVEVAGNWLSRMREAAYSQDAVASVTPFSNNATVCSFPDICENNRLIFDLPLEDIDAAFDAEFSSSDVFSVPTGVGCCMYLRRDCIDLIGLFDEESFGRGYGEENDWCQRALRAGKQNLHLANCFVFHRGGVSFGEEHSPRLADALDTLDRKYPLYHGEIQKFIAADPAREARVRAWLRLFATQNKPKILLVSHKLGGGAQQHVDELARLYGQDALFLLLIPDKDGASVRLSCFDRDQRLRDGLFFEVEREYGKLVALLRGLGLGRVHFHHSLGLPPRILSLPADADCEYDITVHDYFLVSGNATLTDKDANFVAENDPNFEQRCAENLKIQAPADVAVWRATQQSWLQGASRVLFPSLDCQRRFTHFFDLENAVVAWHPDYAESQPYPEPQWQYSSDRPLRVLVLGALSRDKGADTLDSVAAALSQERVEFHLLGYAYRRLGSNVVFHGPYDNGDVEAKLAQIKPDVVWFPARWPETYSYTLSIALHNALPVVVPDIGAFSERVQGRNQSCVMPWDTSVSQWREFWIDVLATGALPAAAPGRAEVAREISTDFYSRAYIQAVPARASELDQELLRDLRRNLAAEDPRLSRSEWLLRGIWRFSLKPAGARLISMVPFKIQRTIKRSLSHRPMHDIVGE